jgi:hypothetical protein
MAKEAKRRPNRSSKTSGAKATKRGGTKQKRAAKAKKRSGSITRSKIKGTAKKAAKAAAVAAGLAAVGTVLTELRRREEHASGGPGDVEEKPLTGC